MQASLATSLRMNMPPTLDWSRLPQPAQDLRPQYEMAIWKTLTLLWRRRLLIAAVAICTVAAALGTAALMSRTYVGEALVQLKFGGDAPAAAGASQVTIDGASLVEGEVEIIRSRAIARRVLERLDGSSAPTTSPPSPPGASVETDRRVLALQSGLTVKNDGKTYIVHIVYAASDPARAAMLANAFAEEYLASRIEASVESAKRTSGWLEAQITQATAEERQAADRVRAFRARPDAVAADAGNAQIRDQQMRDLMAQISAAQGESQRLGERLKRLTDALAAGRIPSAADLQGSTDIQKLIDAEVAARQEASRLAEVLGTKHPLYARADAGHAAALRQLNDAISATASIARADLTSARDTQARLVGQLSSLRAAALDGQMIDRTLRDMESRDATAQANLDRLREAYRQALAIVDLKPIAAQMISMAEPLFIPTSPNLKVIAILSGIGGLAAGVAAVFLVEMRDIGFTTETQAAGELGAPCSGMIPNVGPDEKPGARRSHRQALKSLVIAAGLAERRDGCVVIVVTSTRPGEGKSDLVRGLAETLGDLGRRVLVVDDTALSPEPMGGRGEGGAPSDRDGPAWVDHRTDLVLAPFERPTGDLAEILARSDRFKPWIAEAKTQFDVIVVEAPAVLSDVEGLMIARAADLVLFAVRWRSTPRQAAIAAFRQLIPAPGQQALVVITEVDLREHRRLGTRDNLYFARRYAEGSRV